MVIVYSAGQFEEETSTEVWVQGSNLAYNIDIYISGITLTDYNCRLAIERPDGETSNELIATPLTDNEFYRYTVPSWVTDVAGTVKITTRIKKISDVYYAVRQFLLRVRPATSVTQLGTV